MANQKITKVCEICGVTFPQQSRNVGRFCSRACRLENESPSRRFWSKVVKSEGCWNCIAPGNHGYGRFRLDNRHMMAHRVAYELTHGKIPNGACVCHKCDNRKCCNPSHLFLGTLAENNADRDRKGRQARQRGESHGGAKLTEAQVLEIRSATDTQKQIAIKYGVTRATVAVIRRRERWGWL